MGQKYLEQIKIEISPNSVQKRTKVNKASATARISINELGENKKMSKLTNDPAH